MGLVRNLAISHGVERVFRSRSRLKLKRTSRGDDEDSVVSWRPIPSGAHVRMPIDGEAL
jgi:hypothetical protein